MAHPLENPDGWDKFVKAQEEYPGFRIVPITGRFYRRLERRFQEAIDSDHRFCGWETRKDNLKNNPAKYS